MHAFFPTFRSAQPEGRGKRGDGEMSVTAEMFRDLEKRVSSLEEDRERVILEEILHQVKDLHQRMDSLESEVASLKEAVEDNSRRIASLEKEADEVPDEWELIRSCRLMIRA